MSPIPQCRGRRGDPAGSRLCGSREATYGRCMMRSGSMPRPGRRHSLRHREVRRRVEGPALPAEYHCPARGRHRARLHRRIHRDQDRGTYCRACGAGAVHQSDTKFESHCGWSSFFPPLAGDSIIELEDTSSAYVASRSAARPAATTSAHVFEGEGYGIATDLRYCISPGEPAPRAEAGVEQGRRRPGRPPDTRPGVTTRAWTHRRATARW